MSMRAGTSNESSEIAGLFQEALRLVEYGDFSAARSAYMKIITRYPDHFAALNNLGALLYETGYRTAARTVYAELVCRHPQNPMGHVNLATSLRDVGQLESARDHCTRALKLRPQYPPAHQILAGILAELGDEEGATLHRQLGFAGKRITKLPYRGKGTPVSLLLLVSALGGNIPIRHLIDDTVFETSVVYSEYWNPKERLPNCDLVLNSVGDADLCTSALRLSVEFLKNHRAPVINDPSVVLQTGRVECTRRLSNLEGVRAPRICSIQRAAFHTADALSMLSAARIEFPTLLRSPGFHTGCYFECVDTPEDLPNKASELPGKELIAIEYLNSRHDDGYYRKYRAMFVNGSIFPLHLAISNSWKVHYFTAQMAENSEHRKEEERFLSDMPSVVGQRGMDALASIDAMLELDYAGVDFGLSKSGEILLFEANATMVVNPPEPNNFWDYRREPIAKIQNAVREMLITKSTGGLRSNTQL